MADGFEAAHKRKVKAFRLLNETYKAKVGVSLCRVVDRTFKEIPNLIAKELERGNWERVNTQINRGLALGKLVIECRKWKE